MKINKQELKKLQALARSTKGMFLIEWIEKYKNEVADVRTDLAVEPIHDKPVRLAVCNVLEEMIGELKRHADAMDVPEPNEFS